MNNSLGKNIGNYRRLKKLTQKELAEEMDISRSFMSQIEKGISKPSEENIIKFAEILGVSREDLVKNNDEEITPNLQIVKLLTDLTNNDTIFWKYRDFSFGANYKHELNQYLNNVKKEDKEYYIDFDYYYYSGLTDFNIIYFITFTEIDVWGTRKNYANISNTPMLLKELISVNVSDNKIIVLADNKISNYSEKLLLDLIQEIENQVKNTNIDYINQIEGLRNLLSENNENK